MFVFEKGKPARLVIDPVSFERSLAAVQRYNALTYHCRPRYAIGRIQSLYTLLNSMCFSGWRVRRLIAQLDKHHRERTPLESQKLVAKRAA